MLKLQVGASIPTLSSFLKSFIFIDVYVCASLCVYIHVCARGQKRVLDHLDQKLQVVVSHLTMGLGTKFWS